MVSEQVKLRLYYLTAVFSLVFSLLGFSYNAWRMEVSEDNSNVREAAFEVLKELGALEQLVYVLHYDHDQENGNPRKGWVKVGLIQDLAMLVSPQAKQSAIQLQQVWSKQWAQLGIDQAANDAVVAQIEQVRQQVKVVLLALK